MMKIGILISGRGSNMTAIIEAVKSGQIIDSKVAVVISDKANAEGLQKAKERNIETLVIVRKNRTREEHDAEIVAELKKRAVELICLAGYMRLLSPEFIRAFPDKILNVHPSLLPSFKGLDAQKQAIEYGVKVSGCTVHFVDESLDNGAIVAQSVVNVKDNDTAETLAARILEREHALYVEAIARIVEGKFEIRGRRVIPVKN
ncbi:MAG: phosphoribosylglycinamide formyltransferase [Acidobacteria bacterium]|nr:phosphoribosylglycinamide formyltransferase [Acidobacteriota bacterium]